MVDYKEELKNNFKMLFDHISMSIEYMLMVRMDAEDILEKISRLDSLNKSEGLVFKDSGE